MGYFYSAKNKGFSLIESAIVLGIVGLVIGGIWVGASALNQSFQKTEALKTTLLIVKATQNLFAGQTVSADTDVTTALINAGIIPSDWVKSSGAASPWNGNVTVGVGANKIAISFENVPKMMCVDLASRMPGIVGSPTDVTTRFGCVMNSCCVHGTPGVVTLATANSSCAEGGWFSWNFGLRGGTPTGTGSVCR